MVKCRDQNFKIMTQIFFSRSSVGETVLDKSKLSVDLKNDATSAADNEDVLDSEFAKIQDEAYQIFFVKKCMNKGQIHKEHNRYKDMGKNIYSNFPQLDIIYF